MPRGLLSLFLRLVHDGGRRRQSRRRRHGVGGLRRHNRNTRDLRRFRGRRADFYLYGRRRHGPRLGQGAQGLGAHFGAGPSGASPEPAMPAAAPLSAWILARPAAPNLYADEVLEPVDGAMDVDAVEPELAAPPPPHPCPMHGWGPCPTPSSSPPLDYEVHEEVEPAPPALPAQPDSPRLPSPTPAHETVAVRASAASFGLGMHLPSAVGARAMNADTGACSSSASFRMRLPAPTAAHGDIFDNGAGNSSGPSTPRRWHIVPRAVLQHAGRRPGRWSPVNLGLANGHSNGVAPGAHLPGGTSSSEEDAASGPAASGPSTSRR